MHEVLPIGFRIQDQLVRPRQRHRRVIASQRPCVRGARFRGLVARVRDGRVRIRGGDRTIGEVQQLGDPLVHAGGRVATGGRAVDEIGR